MFFRQYSSLRLCKMRKTLIRNQNKSQSPLLACLASGPDKTDDIVGLCSRTRMVIPIPKMLDLFRYPALIPGDDSFWILWVRC